MKLITHVSYEIISSKNSHFFLRGKTFWNFRYTPYQKAIDSQNFLNSLRAQDFFLKKFVCVCVYTLMCMCG